MLEFSYIEELQHMVRLMTSNHRYEKDLILLLTNDITIDRNMIKIVMSTKQMIKEKCEYKA